MVKDVSKIDVVESTNDAGLARVSPYTRYLAKSPSLLFVQVKVVCWLVLSGLTGMAFRMTGQIPMLRAVAAVVILIAVAMVIYKPF